MHSSSTVQKVVGKLRVLGLAFAVCALTIAMCSAFGINAYADTYVDGQYEGTGQGRNGAITLKVTIAEGQITGIEEVSQSETSRYWESAKQIFDSIINAQSTDVDVVSGATLSCDGIKDAVDDALSKAVEVDSGLFASGTGTAEDPYVVMTADQLRAFAADVDGGNLYAGEYIVLGDDIDISGSNWNPIGSETDQNTIFAGSFDGAGHTITGLAITGEAAYAGNVWLGLFSSIDATASVENVNLAGVDISPTVPESNTGWWRIGGITGGTKSGGGVVDGCTVSGTITLQAAGAKPQIGGIVGNLGSKAQLSNCISYVTLDALSSTGQSYAGGITSMAGNNAWVINCAAYGDVSSISASGMGYYAGGLVGMASGKIYNNYVSANVTMGKASTETGSTVGFVVGWPGYGASDNNYFDSSKTLTLRTYTDATSYIESVLDATGAGFNDYCGEVVTEAVADASPSAVAQTLNSTLAATVKVVAGAGASFDLLEWTTDEGGTALPNGEVFINDTPDASIFASGTGTAEDPFIIMTEQQLRDFATSFTEKLDYTDTYIRLGADIDCSSADWTPIGESAYYFNGHFDGAGFTISNLKLGTQEAPANLAEAGTFTGLFSALSKDAVVANVNIRDMAFYTTVTGSSAYIGGICGYADGATEADDYTGAVIDSCSVTGTIVHTADGANQFVGGIIGNQRRGALINSWTDVDASCTVISGDSLAEVGGLVALSNRALVANCYSLGDVYASGSRDNGDEGMGVASPLVAVGAGTLVGCYSAGGSVTGEYSVYIGGVSGWITGIGKAYNNFFSADALMQAGDTVYNPNVAYGTLVPGGKDEEGDHYVGGIVDKLESFTESEYAGLAERLNGYFVAYPADIALFGVANDQLKVWTVADGVVTLGTESAEVSYVRPDAENVPEPTYELQDGVWYGRDEAETTVVAITVVDGEITTAEVISGDASGEAFEEALEVAKAKSSWGDFASYEAGDPSNFAGGTGTAEDPYIIENEEQLRYLAVSINEDESWEGQYFALANDIELSDDDFVPIGRVLSGLVDGLEEQVAAYPFRGSFDGRDHTISGLTIGSADEPAKAMTAALFGFVTGDYANNNAPAEQGDVLCCTIANVNLVDVAIYASNPEQAYVAPLLGAGQNGVFVDNCSAEGVLVSHTENSHNRTGGLAASLLRGRIINSSADVQVTCISDKGRTYAGGLIGMSNRCSVINSYALGDVLTTAGAANYATVGGLTGLNGGLLINCYASGNVTSTITSQAVGALNGNLAGIAYESACYYNSDAVVTNGDTIVDPVAASGMVVPTSDQADSVEGRSAEEIVSADFADELNANRENIETLLAAADEYLGNNAQYSQAIYFDGTTDDLKMWGVCGEYVGFFEPADTSALEAALASVPEDLSGYSDTSAALVEAAVTIAGLLPENPTAADQEVIDAVTLLLQNALDMLQPTMYAYAGADRFATASMAARELAAAGPVDGIIVVGGQGAKFPDALSAAGLSGVTGYPVVMVNGTGLTADNIAALDAVASDDLDIVIIGGTATVTAEVESALSAYGTVSERIAGADRYAVNSAVYEYGAAHGTWGDSVFVARGDNFPDALTIAPYLVANSAPIILVDPKATALTDDQRAIAQGASRGIVLGGTASVTEALQADLAATCGSAERLGGANRYEASANIVAWELEEGMTLEGAGFATGANFPDALSSAPLLGHDGAVLCLVSSTASENAAMFEVIEDANPPEVRVFGGTASVTDATREAIASALGWDGYEKVDVK